MFSRTFRLQRTVRSTPIAVASAALLVISAACGGGSTTPTGPGGALRVQQVDVSAQSGGDAHFTALGQTRQLQARVHFSDGSDRIVTTGVSWQSVNNQVATVSASGLVTAVGPGSSSVRATYEGVLSRDSFLAQVRVSPDLNGTWRGTYSNLVQAGVGGIMIVSFARNNTGAFVGTFTVEDDLHLGRVTGTAFAAFRPYPNERQLDFAFSAPKGGMSREPSCGLMVSGLATMDNITALVTQYRGNWCDGGLGTGTFGFTGALNLQKQ